MLEPRRVCQLLQSKGSGRGRGRGGRDVGPAIPSLLANPGLKVDKELGQLEKTLDPKE